MFDATMYEAIGNNLATSFKYCDIQGKETVIYTPGYPLFIAAVYWFTGRHYFNVRVAQSLVNSLMVLIIFFIAKRVFNRRTAYLSAIISMLYPFFIYNCGELLRETLYSFILALSVLSLLRVIDNFSSKRIAISGICLGFTFMVKPVLAFFPLLVFLWLLFYRDRLKLKKTIWLMVVYCFTILLVMLPWVVRNGMVFHKFIPTAQMGGWTLWVGNNPRATGGGEAYHDPVILEKYDNWTERDKAYKDEALKYIKNNPARFLKLSIKKLIQLYKIMPISNIYEGTNDRNKIISILSYGVLFPFFIAGLFLNLKTGRESIIIYFVLALNTVIHMVFPAMIRYRLPAEPYIIMFASSAIVFFSDKILRKETNGNKNSKNI